MDQWTFVMDQVTIFWGYLRRCLLLLADSIHELPRRGLLGNPHTPGPIAQGPTGSDPR